MTSRRWCNEGVQSQTCHSYTTCCCAAQTERADSRRCGRSRSVAGRERASQQGATDHKLLARRHVFVRGIWGGREDRLMDRTYWVAALNYCSVRGVPVRCVLAYRASWHQVVLPTIQYLPALPPLPTPPTTPSTNLHLWQEPRRPQSVMKSPSMIEQS